MINIYDKREKDFGHMGLCVMNEAISCVVTEELNGLYKLEMEYPITESGKYKYLTEENIIKVPTPECGKQLFRIAHKRESEKSIHIVAYHIFYDLLDNMVLDSRPTDCLADNAIKKLLTDSIVQMGFVGSSDITTVSTSYYIRRNIVDCLLGDDENSFLNRWGGEIIRDNFNIIMKNHRGVDRGFPLKYGKNIIGIEVQTDTTELATRVIPTCLNSINNTVIELPEKFIDSPLIGNYSHPYIVEVRFDDIQLVADDQEGIHDINEIYRLMREKTNKLFSEQHTDVPKSNFRVDFISLFDTEEYKEYKILEKCYIGDTVTIDYKPLNVNIKARVISYQYDCIAEKYIKLELGNYVDKFGSETKREINKLSKDINYSNKRLTNQEIAVNTLTTQLSDNIKRLDLQEDKLVQEINSLNNLTAQQKLELSQKIQNLENLNEQERLNLIKNINDLTNLTEEQKTQLTKQISDLSIYTKTNIDSLRQSLETLKINMENMKSELEKNMNDSIDVIQKGLGGYVVKRNGEILIMDTEDPSTATQVWRWNKNGLAYSHGYSVSEGEWEVAIDMLGRINCNFLGAGKIKAVDIEGSVIKGGVYYSTDGQGNMYDQNATRRLMLDAGHLILEGKDKDLFFETSKKTNTIIEPRELRLEQMVEDNLVGDIGEQINSTRYLPFGILQGGTKDIDGIFQKPKSYTISTPKFRLETDAIETNPTGLFNTVTVAKFNEKYGFWATSTGDTWHTVVPNWNGGWGWYGGNYSDLACKMEGCGVVRLRGMVRNSNGTASSGSVIATLDPPYRPQYPVNVLVATGGTSVARIEIFTNGNITYMGGYVSYISFDGITFDSVSQI